MTATLTQAAANTKATKGTQLPQVPQAKAQRSVEEMLRDISLVLWLTRRVKEEILAEAAPQRGNLLTPSDATAADEFELATSV